MQRLPVPGNCSPTMALIASMSSPVEGASEGLDDGSAEGVGGSATSHTVRTERDTNRTMMNEVVVVGGSLAGLRAVETLRSGGFGGGITVIGAERHLPYDRPPLSKRLLSGEWEPERIALRKPDDMDSLDVSWRTGIAATGLDTDARQVSLADGSTTRVRRPDHGHGCHGSATARTGSARPCGRAAHARRFTHTAQPDHGRRQTGRR